MRHSLLHRGHANCPNTPHEHNGGEEDARVHLGQKQVSRELSNSVTDVKGRNAGIPNRVAHVKIVLESRQSGVRDVHAVEMAEQLAHASTIG